MTSDRQCKQQVTMSRRSFLKGIPVVTAGAVALPQAAQASTPDDGSKYWAMLIDIRRCIGCQACTMTCIQENAVPEGNFRTIVSSYSVKMSDAPDEQPAGAYVLPRLCNHCDNPPCVPVCPVGATFKRQDGIVVVNAERCVGCAYCVQACPYDARFINGDTLKADKCTFCLHRVDAGLLPGCVETCVGGARIFGDLNDPNSEISQRMAEHKDELKVLKPEMGTQPRVYYVGLDDRFVDKIEGDSTLWKPRDRGETAYR